jgi:hypothetical protein
VADDAVVCEPVSQGEFPANRENNGEFQKFGLFGEKFSLRYQRVEDEFPKIQNRELIRIGGHRRQLPRLRNPWGLPMPAL